MLVVHHNDADGRCSAAIVLKAHDRMNMRFQEMDYKDELDIDSIKPDEQVIIVDFSLKPEVMKKLWEKTQNVTWIDHHVTAGDYDYGPEIKARIKGLRNFKDKAEAGCELAWRHFFEGQPVPMAVALLGDYDKFALKKPTSLPFFEGLKMETGIEDPKSAIWRQLLSPRQFQNKDLDRIIENGRTAMKYRDAYCKEMRDAFGYETELGGLKCFATNIYKFGSKGFGDRMKEYDACIAYAHDGNKFTVSMYSDKDGVDVSKVCKEQGGGGHRSAAGFTAAELPFKPKTVNA